MIRQNQQGKKNNRPSEAVGVWMVPEGISVLTASGVHAYPEIDAARRIILPDSVRQIEQYCFASLHNLEEVQFPVSLDEIGRGIFQHCWNLRRVRLPEGTRLIDNAFFYGCGRLRFLKIPYTVKEIDRDALKTCEQLTDVEISDAMFSRYPRSVRLLAALTFVKNAPADSRALLADGAPGHKAAAYISAHKCSLLDIAIAKNDPDAVYQMLRNPMFTGDLEDAALQSLANRANREGRTEIMVLLLNELQKRNLKEEEEGFAW